MEFNFKDILTTSMVLFAVIDIIGNIPIIGDYPGPTDEAMTHLNKVIANLPS